MRRGTGFSSARRIVARGGSSGRTSNSGSSRRRQRDAAYHRSFFPPQSFRPSCPRSDRLVLLLVVFSPIKNRKRTTVSVVTSATTAKMNETPRREVVLYASPMISIPPSYRPPELDLDPPIDRYSRTKEPIGIVVLDDRPRTICSNDKHPTPKNKNRL